MTGARDSGLPSQSAPSIPVVALGLAIAGAVLFAQRPILASFALFDGRPTTVGGGAVTLALAAVQSMALVTLSLAPAFLVVVVVLALVIKRPRAMRLVGGAFSALSNLPILFLLPIWLVAFGNSYLASFTFLTFCFLFLIGYSVFADQSGGAAIAQRVSIGFSFGPTRTFLLTLEVILACMRTSVFKILILGLPLALAAEMISNRSGLGYLAGAAYLNGNFGQVGLTAAAYLIAFCVLWFAWSVALFATKVVGVLADRKIK